MTTPPPPPPRRFRRNARVQPPERLGAIKGTVEIISGRDRRLQGQGEETGSRLQRDRSGVSEMEPLPAAQDALRLELRPARSLEVRHLLSPFGSPLHDTVDPAVVVVFGLLDVRKAHKSTPTDFTPITRGTRAAKILLGTPSFRRARGNDGEYHILSTIPLKLAAREGKLRDLRVSLY